MSKKLFLIFILVVVSVFSFKNGFLSVFAQDANPQPIVVQEPYTTDNLLSSINAVVIWTTNVPTTSFVAYSDAESGFTSIDPPGWGKWRVNNATLTTEHKVFIGGLSLNSTYYFRVNGQDAQNRQIVESPPVRFLTTHYFPNVLSGPSAVNILSNEATIEWATNSLTTSFVAYSLVDSNFTGNNPENWGTWRYDKDRPDAQNNLDFQQNFVSMIRNHSVRIGGLQPNTKYFYRVSGRDYPYIGNFTVPSAIANFTTASLPATATPATCGLSVGETCCATTTAPIRSFCSGAGLYCLFIGELPRCQRIADRDAGVPDWSSSFNTSNDNFDFNDDDIVNGIDYALWLKAGHTL